MTGKKAESDDRCRGMQVGDVDGGEIYDYIGIGDIELSVLPAPGEVLDNSSE